MRCHECGSEDHLVAKCPRRAAANDSSQNLFVDLDTADQIPPGVITSTTVLMVNEVDANVGQESGTDHWSTVSGGPPSNASTLPAAPQDPWANSDPWRRYKREQDGETGRWGDCESYATTAAHDPGSGYGRSILVHAECLQWLEWPDASDH